MATTAACLVVAAPAAAAPGSLTFRDCLTSNTSVSACLGLSGAVAGGVDTQLDELHSVAVSADGTDLYAASTASDAVASFRRDPATGALTYQGCISADTQVTACSLIVGATSNGFNRVLDALSAVVVSADGKSVYTSSEGSDAVGRFDRDPATGALSYQGCISSNSATVNCTPIPGAVASGTNTGLDELRSLTVSADGTSVYTVSSTGDSIGRFNRDPATGALTYIGCVSSNSNISDCTPIPGAVAGGNNTALNSLYTVTVSADGKDVYPASYDGFAVAHFARGASGELTFQSCLTSKLSVSGCTAISGATANNASALSNAISITGTADNRNVYVAAEDSDALSRFDRDPATGNLTYQGCISSDSNTVGCVSIPGSVPDGMNTALKYPETVAASADGFSVYTVSDDDSLAQFSRDPATGAIAFVGCLTGDSATAGCTPVPGAAATGLNSPLNELFGLAVSADGRSVYTGARQGDSVARFDRELPPAALPSNEFAFGKLKRNKRKGTAKLTVELPGPGSLALGGTGVKAAAREATAAGELKLPVKAKGKRAKRLRKRGKAKLKAEVTFTPTGGEANTQTKPVKLIRRR